MSDDIANEDMKFRFTRAGKQLLQVSVFPLPLRKPDEPFIGDYRFMSYFERSTAMPQIKAFIYNFERNTLEKTVEATWTMPSHFEAEARSLLDILGSTLTWTRERPGGAIRNIQIRFGATANNVVFETPLNIIERNSSGVIIRSEDVGLPKDTTVIR